MIACSGPSVPLPQSVEQEEIMVYDHEILIAGKYAQTYDIQVGGGDGFEYFYGNFRLHSLQKNNVYFGDNEIRLERFNKENREEYLRLVETIDLTDVYLYSVLTEPLMIKQDDGTYLITYSWGYPQDENLPQPLDYLNTFITSPIDGLTVTNPKVIELIVSEDDASDFIDYQRTLKLVVYGSIFSSSGEPSIAISKIDYYLGNWTRKLGEQTF
ncbi:MAG TPA: hypothetical protein DCR93_30615 [Cytophagales bacterium]|nr:hypothetical protein [Cytophagales bacterium]